jgi:uncharacterized protein YihD (DUF1040 family)
MLLIQQLQNLKRTSMYDGSFDDFIDGALFFHCIASYR